MSVNLAAHDHDVSSFGWIEWTLIGLAAVAVVWVIWKAVVLTLRPGEDDPGHIKRMILDDDLDARAGDGPLAPGHHGGNAAPRNS